MKRQRNTLIGQVLAVNVLLVTAALFAASVAAQLNLTIEDQRATFSLLAVTITLALAANIMMLRRRFSPLERLIERVESIDPAQPDAFEMPEEGAYTEVGRLAASFRRLLERIEAERRRSGRLVLRAQEEERKRVARDLHDEVNQALTALLLRLQALSQDAPDEMLGEIAELKSLVNQAMDELLQLARQLRPTALDDHGLVPAVDAQVKRFGSSSGIRASFDTKGDPSRLSADEQIVVYRVAQESLNNISHHSDASRVEVNLAARDEGGVTLRVRDDGKGFDPSRSNGGLGLNGMAERARLIGGNLEVQSAPGDGTTVLLHIP
jgi:two-component system, NarL family, sensor histidine kinase UhpB